MTQWQKLTAIQKIKYIYWVAYEYYTYKLLRETGTLLESIAKAITYLNKCNNHYERAQAMHERDKQERRSK